MEDKKLQIYKQHIKADRSDHHILQSELSHLFTLESFKEVRSQTLPRKLILNAINVCNADCVFCAYQYRVDPNTTMPIELVDKVTAEYAAFHPSSFVTFTPTVGDPLIDREIFQKVNLAKKNGIKRVQFYTNAILLESRIPELMSSLLDNLEISIPDFDEQIYEEVFRSKAYTKVLKGLSRLLERLKEEDHPLLVQINIRGVRSLDEIQKAPDYLKHIAPFMTERIFFSETPEFDNWMGLIQQSDLPTGMKLMDDKKSLNKMPCRRLFDIQVLADGKVRICGCRSGKTVYDDLIIGDLSTQSLLEIWDSPELMSIMNSFFDGKYPKACLGCNYYEPVNSKASRTFVKRS